MILYSVFSILYSQLERPEGVGSFVALRGDGK
jgi:hypothetical protein